MKSLFKTIVLSVAVLGITIGCSAQKGIRIVPDDAGQKIDVLYDGKLFTSYTYPAGSEKPVLYPVNTARGTVITRGFPRDPRPFERNDHPHHVGAWFNFGDVNGIDFWNNSSSIPASRKSGYGTIRHRKAVSARNGSNKGVLTVAADWVNHTEKVLLTEETQFVFRGKGDWRIIERITTLTAGKDTVTFTDNKEGMIAIRMDRAFEEPSNRAEQYLDAQGNPTEVRVMNSEGMNGVYRNSEGLQKGAVWGKPTQWVSLSAKKGEEEITVAIIDHRNNPGYPAYSHARGYGLFSTNNMGRQAFDKNAPLFQLTLNPGQSTVFRHMIIVKTGGFATDAEVNKIFADFNK
jgi:hypothetical protein